MLQEERNGMFTEESVSEGETVYEPGEGESPGADDSTIISEEQLGGEGDSLHGDGWVEGKGDWPPDDEGSLSPTDDQESGTPEFERDAMEEAPTDGAEGQTEETPSMTEEPPAAEEPPPKPARKRSTRKKAAEEKKADEEFSGVPEEQEAAPVPARSTRRSATAPVDDVDAEEMSLAQRKREAAQQRQKWRREREKTAILDVDGTSMVDDSDGFDEKAAAVYQAKNTRLLCCGPITGVKFSRGTGHYVEAEYNGFRVLIPFKEMDITLERQRGDSDNDYENKTITAIRNMVGAEIEFIILDIDENEQIAIASRRMATEYRRKTVLNGINRDGEYHIYPTRKVVARVLDVHPFYAWVEVAGWRTRLSASELRAEYVEDMTTELANGQRITVAIMELTRDRTGNVIDMRISMRDDEKEKRDLEKAMAGINIGDIIRCEVVGRSSKVIRLKTHNGARAFCYIAKGLHGRYIPKLDESVTIKVIRKTTNPRTGNPVLQGNILRRSVKPGVL